MHKNRVRFLCRYTKSALFEKNFKIGATVWLFSGTYRVNGFSNIFSIFEKFFEKVEQKREKNRYILIERKNGGRADGLLNQHLTNIKK